MLANIQRTLSQSYAAGQRDRGRWSRSRRQGEGMEVERGAEGERGGEETEETLQDEGAAEEKGQLLFLSYGNGNEVGHGAGDNGELRAG